MKLFKKIKKSELYNSNKSLTQIANDFETDKGDADKMTLSWGKDWPKHYTMGYTYTYEKYMSNKRNINIKLFEVGIRDKRFPYASCKMWMTYFKDIDLYGMDNFWGQKLSEQEVNDLNMLGVNFVYANQGNFLDWDEIKKQCPNDFDFFIEDGSHWLNHMMVSLWQSKDIIKSGGYYFMEDIQNPLKSRGWYCYDNSLITEELLKTFVTQKIESSFLNKKQNKEINDNFKLIDLVLDSNEINYLAVFLKK